MFEGCFFGSVESESRKRFQVIGNSVPVYIVQQNKPGNGDRESCINVIQLLILTPNFTACFISIHVYKKIFHEAQLSFIPFFLLFPLRF